MMNVLLIPCESIHPLIERYITLWGCRTDWDEVLHLYCEKNDKHYAKNHHNTNYSLQGMLAKHHIKGHDCADCAHSSTIYQSTWYYTIYTTEHSLVMNSIQ